MAPLNLSRSEALASAEEKYARAVLTSPSSPARVPLLLKALVLATLAPTLPEVDSRSAYGRGGQEVS